MADTRIVSFHDVLPEPTLSRLPWYLAYVSLLKVRRVAYVSSTAIARGIHLDASMVAKDLSFVNVRGKTRIGYEVVELERELRSFLGFDRQHNAVIAGVGSLGAALIADSGLQRYGLDIVAGFDVERSIIGTIISGVPVFDITQVAEVRADMQAEIGVIAVPVEQAQAVADTLIDAGVSALWNFTPCRLLAPENIVIQNTSIYAHLAVMYNRINANNPDLTR
ncbi:redox-sensing transcriptional repressor Rex [Paramuribaculum intestinale]|uniref:redox-sensing transcriptional repressor Rex n=1 Tax=Paramuribaculum intestinale TaxID=2094151 RepID=UPI0025A99DBB|nr:redox-sensing transcriptional repressor Rex [Paramuribaculum intestinale]